jgi:hypothetical protein
VLSFIDKEWRQSLTVKRNSRSQGKSKAFFYTNKVIYGRRRVCSILASVNRDSCLRSAKMVGNGLLAFFRLSSAAATQGSADSTEIYGLGSGPITPEFIAVRGSHYYYSRFL